jgi:hypothetical protein
MALKKIKSWNIAVEWQHSDDTWNTEWIEQDSIDKTTFKKDRKIFRRVCKNRKQTRGVKNENKTI